MSNSEGSALAKALAVQQRAAALGFDWPDAEGPREKISEELTELDEATRRDIAKPNPPAIEEELGDLLFAIVNYARHLGLGPEQALAASNEKFCRRFRYIEKRLSSEGLQPGDVKLERLDALWDEAKRLEKG